VWGWVVTAFGYFQVHLASWKITSFQIRAASGLDLNLIVTLFY
jgi:hypothetical protein